MSETVAASRTIPYTADQLAESAAAFAEKITPAKERWEYCFARASYAYGDGRCINSRTVPVVARILGVHVPRAKFNLSWLKRRGFDAAKSDLNARSSILGDRFAVGPMQAWHVGHLYFARVRSHPHVVKIGFSRRLHDRFDDIASKAKVKLYMAPGEVRAGTLADEHWWHRDWGKFRISGEWFFDPHMSERTLPNFLAGHDQAVAA
jgi:hypothetical protein